MCVAALGVFLLAAFPVYALEDSECLACHGDPNKTVAHADGSARPIYVDAALYGASVHGKEGCIACHADVESLEHPKDLAPVNCDNCHDIGTAYAKSPHGQLLKNGDSDIKGCIDCHGMHDIRRAADPLSRTNPLNLPKTCGRCHSDPAIARRHMISVMDPSDSYLKSMHSRKISEGSPDAATCVRCHGGHDLLPSDDPASRVYHKNIPATCGGCHSAELADYEAGIHGKALAAGVKDAPTCVDCHGEHAVVDPRIEASEGHGRRAASDICIRCHNDERVMKRYGITTGRQASYMDSFHGLSGGRSEIVASCDSCHGPHKILARDDPASSVNPANLPATCGKCHPEAGPNFAVGVVHMMPTDTGQRALGIVRLIYILAIAGTIGGMLFHNTLSFVHQAGDKLRAAFVAESSYRRFSRAMTFGHMALALSFITLALSGFALRYPDAWWAQIVFHGETGLALRGLIHRISAVVLIAVAVVNAVFLVCTRAGRLEFGYLMLRIQDIKDIFHNMGYMLGICKTHPRFDRYNYMEKLEYWGMWWGTVLMILTGFCMWFVNQFLSLFPKIALDIVALIHYYEAWLAILTIAVWHFYFMIFEPDTYPMNWTWITGNISLKEMKERHPLEYEREVLGEDPANKD